MTTEEIKDELLRMLSDIINGSCPIRNNAQRGRYREVIKSVIKFLDQNEDCISRQEMLKYFESWKNQIKYYHPYAKNFDIPYEEAIQRIKDAPPAKCINSENSDKWIPISSGILPKDGERVLATHLGGINPNRQVIKHIYQNGRFVLGWDLDTDVDSPTFGQRYMGEIIAWMPEPEPYMAEGDNKK